MPPSLPKRRGKRSLDQEANPNLCHAGPARAIHRRRFLKTAGVLAGLAYLPRRVWAGEAPAILPVKNPNSKLQLAVVGLGGISGGHTLGITRDEHLVALCECSPYMLNARFEQIKKYEVNNVKPEDMQLFQDYRVMLEKMAGKLDGVVVCTPDHNHAIIALDCMKRGIHAFVEKPMCHNIHEAYVLRDAARKYRVATAAGNEAHTGETTRVGIERLLAGQLGAVTEVYFWLGDRSIGGTEEGLVSQPRASVDEAFRLWSVPVPAEIANVNYEYEKGVEIDPLAKWAWGWRGDRRWGNGSLGDFGAHQLDVAHYGLELGKAPTWTIECLERLYGGERLHYKMEVYRWRVSARGKLPPVDIYWHSGVRPNPNAEVVNEFHQTLKAEYNMPAKAREIQKRYDYELPVQGGLVVAEKGVAILSSYGIRAIFPRELQKELPEPPKILPRIDVPKGVDSNRGEWYHAIRTGEPATTHFDYGAPFTEFYLSGQFASRVPLGTVKRMGTYSGAVAGAGQAKSLQQPHFFRAWNL